jgi:hypothetical protein
LAKLRSEDYTKAIMDRFLFFIAVYEPDDDFVEIEICCNRQYVISCFDCLFT